MVEELDVIDRTILNMLQQDARVPFSTIAQKLSVSEATIRYRVKQLEKTKVIKNYTTLLSPAKVGFSTTGIMMVKIDPEKFDSAADQIGAQPETYHVFQNTGEYDVVSVVHTRDLEHLSELRKRVQAIAGVRDVTVSAATRIIKIKTSFDL
ncbi:Lrp/AsnC family transcriptional regulator [Candidatus Bathyarchaeota archaeon]|nr:Lrp/AsnC family transcriptional regulator [Candidatus Bathyarchaeota archaeon]